MNGGNRPGGPPPGIRLPGLPPGVANAYEPPRSNVSPQETIARNLGKRIDREEDAQTWPIQAVGSGGPGQETSVWTSQSSWRGCDVYVTPLPPPGGFTQNGCLSFFIYARSKGGTRTLVASGRYGVPTTLTSPAPRWIAGVRCLSAAFEVTFQFTQNSGAPAAIGGKVAVQIVASNEAVALPEDLGCELGGLCYTQANNGVSLGVGVAGIQFPSRVQLVRLRGVNGSAAARSIQLFDLDAPVATPPNGTAALLEWPLGSAAGQGIATIVNYRARNRLQLAVSSTTNVLTIANDCAISAELR